MLDKTFGLFSPQKVPAIAGIGGKIQVLFPPHTPHPAPRKSFFSKPIYWLENQEYIPRHQSQYFPDFNLENLVSFCGEIADNRNSSMAIRQLKQHLEDFYSISTNFSRLQRLSWQPSKSRTKLT